MNYKGSKTKWQPSDILRSSKISLWMHKDERVLYITKHRHGDGGGGEKNMHSNCAGRAF